MGSVGNGTVFDCNGVKQKIEFEFQFITSVLDRVPSTYWKVPEDEDAEKVDSKIFVQGTRFNKHPSVTPRARDVEELHRRLEVLKAKKKQGYRDLVNKKKLKAKAKKHQKKDESNQKHQMKLDRQKANQTSKSGSNADETSDKKPSKPVFNSEGKMVFSKFDFSEVGSHLPEKKKKKELKDPRKILEKLKEQKETIRRLKGEGQVAKALEITQKEAWSKALKKAEGVKIKDDPELLKKTLARDEQRKKQSAKKWAAREYGQKKAMKERQQKRETNIQARKDAKKQKKRAKAIKKGRLIPGF